MITLKSDIATISRVGQTTARRLKKIGINTVEDLLLYFPFRYDDFSDITLISDLMVGQKANIVGQIELIQSKRSFRKKMSITEALVSDDSDSIKIIWFNQSFIAKNLKPGDRVSLAGKVEDDYGGLVMKSPSYEKVGASNVNTQGLVPVYHLTENITQKQLRFLIKQVINFSLQIVDWLPASVKNKTKLCDLGEAIKTVHFPKDHIELEKARTRLAFDELFLLQIQSTLIRLEAKKENAESLVFKEKETRQFVSSLPFTMTNAQKKASWVILKDMEKREPMSRLLQGDVGSGKTLVAVMAALNVALNNKQAVIMVPTEILAKQHYENIVKLLSKFKINIGLITRSEKKMNNESSIMYNGKKEKNKKNHDTKYIIHNSSIIIGTHALIQEDIVFKNLGLVVIDEQHRFGVEQRKKLTAQSGGITPHFLSMTATPIPRSLALALYGELDVSIIDEMPKDRKTILTKIIYEENRHKAYEFIRSEIGRGRQAFVICPLIDASDKYGQKSVTEEFEKLNKEIFPDLEIGYLHGKMKAIEKNKIMKDFLDNVTKVLVSTSVIEVGVDVPNATIMMIEGSDKFGLAQLHQFRGRVGRSHHQSYCFLFSENKSDKILKRLQALVDYSSGYDLAKMDLKFRGPGEFYGTAQKGFPELKIASLFDYQLMKEAKLNAEKLLSEDYTLEKWPLLKNKIKSVISIAHLE